MSLPPDEFHIILEQFEDVQEHRPAHRHPSIPTVEALRAWARRLQAHPALKADPDFARQLENRLLERNAELHRSVCQRRWWNWFLPRRLRK